MAIMRRADLGQLTDEERLVLSSGGSVERDGVRWSWESDTRVVSDDEVFARNRASRLAAGLGLNDPLALPLPDGTWIEDE